MDSRIIQRLDLATKWFITEQRELAQLVQLDADVRPFVYDILNDNSNQLMCSRMICYVFGQIKTEYAPNRLICNTNHLIYNTNLHY